MIVHLTAQELMIAAHNAGLIEGVKSVQVRHGSVSNKRISSLPDFAIHYAGMMGEVAVSMAIGVPIRTEITYGGDSGVDLSFQGQTIQVKTSTHKETPKPRFIIFNSEDDFATDWAVSCSIQSESSVKIHGFTSKRKFLLNMTEHDFGYGRRICLDEKHLAPIERFREACEVMA